jgi:hypothetical protein
VRLGWIVLAHQRPAQVARLLRRLEAPPDSLFLHVDRAARGEFDAALNGLRDRVVLLPRLRSRWGTEGILSATLAGVRAALSHGADYISVVSGQDYPIKPIEALRAHLDRASGAAFMLYFALPNPDWTEREAGLWRVNRRHYRLGRHSLRLPNRWTPFIPTRRVPMGYQPFAGSNWWTLPRDCASYLVRFLDENPGFLSFYRRVALPAESLPHTVLLNSPLRDRVVFNDLRHIVWRSGDPHPATLGPGDLPDLERSAAFLARKFDAERDPGLLDEIDERLLGVCALPPLG